MCQPDLAYVKLPAVSQSVSSLKLQELQELFQATGMLLLHKSKNFLMIK